MTAPTAPSPGASPGRASLWTFFDLTQARFVEGLRAKRLVQNPFQVFRALVDNKLMNAYLPIYSALLRGACVSILSEQ